MSGVTIRQMLGVAPMVAPGGFRFIVMVFTCGEVMGELKWDKKKKT